MSRKSSPTYSQRRLYEMVKLAKDTRKAMGWIQADLALFAGCGTTLICELEKKNVKKTKLVKRTVSNITKLWKLIESGDVPAGTSVDQAREMVGVQAEKSLIETPTQPTQQDLPFQKPKLVKSEVGEQILQLETVDALGTSFLARLIEEHDYEIAMFSVCDFLGISEVRDQAKKLIERGFGDLVGQSPVRLPSGAVQRNVWMIKRQALMYWLSTIHPNNVSAHRREGLMKLQRECLDALDRYFFSAAVVNPRADETTVMLAVLEQLKLMHRSSETTQKALQSLISTNAELALQVSQTNRNIDARISEMLTDYEVVAPGKFRKRDTGVLYINLAHVIFELRGRSRVKEWMRYYQLTGRTIDKNRMAWIANLMIKVPTYVPREDMGPLEGSIDHRVYSPDDINLLEEGLLAWIALRLCRWQKKPIVVNGRNTDVMYPDLTDAQRLLFEVGFNTDVIQPSVDHAVRVLRLPGK